MKYNFEDPRANTPIMRFSIERDYNNKPHFLGNFVFAQRENVFSLYSNYYSYNEGITQDCIFSHLQIESWMFGENFSSPNFGYELNYETLRAGGTMEAMKERIKFIEKVEKELRKLDNKLGYSETLSDYITRLMIVLNFRIMDQFGKFYTLPEFIREISRYEDGAK